MRLRDLPIRQKLVLIVMLTSAGALLLAVAGLGASELLRSRRELERDLATLAEIVAGNSTAALAFQDPPAARETLGTLRARTDVATAALYDRRAPVRPAPASRRAASSSSAR
jgi:Periplasmic sensor domain